VDVIVFDSRELPVALGALRALVPRPSERQARYIEVIARLHGVALNAKRVAPVANERVAAVISDPHKRGRLVQLAVIMTLVDGADGADGKLDPEPAAAVAQLAAALAVDEQAVRLLPHVLERHRLTTRLVMMRRIMKKFVGEAWRDAGFGGVYGVLANFFGGGANRATAARYAALEHYPAGSLGRTLWQHCKNNGFKLPGEGGGMPERILFHDMGHLFSGFSTEPEGEIQQAAFQAGFVRTDGFAFLFFGVIQFHLGIKITPVAEPQVGYFDVDKVMTALARGAACKVDLSDNWDFWAHAARPIDEVRAELGISPPGTPLITSEPKAA
jgi:hypothetical protein